MVYTMCHLHLIMGSMITIMGFTRTVRLTQKEFHPIVQCGTRVLRINPSLLFSYCLSNQLPIHGEQCRQYSVLTYWCKTRQSQTHVALAHSKIPNKRAKGQFISKRIFGVENFPKFDPKNLKDFCPDI